MEWNLTFDEKENILFVKTFGIFDLATKIELTKECVVALEEQSCRQCVIDNRKIESASIRFMEIYSIPEKFADLGVPHNLRIAEVFSEKHKKDFDFLEVICHNNSYWLSVFSDVESALQWLKR